MFYYARSDTHYLLYIYDMMRNELLDQSGEGPTQNLVHQVLDRSKTTSLRRYETSKYDAEGGSGPFGWFNLLIKHSSGKLSKEQFAVFRALHKWRDEVARREDESALYIMNNSTLFDVTRQMPPDPKALHSLLATSHIAKRDAFNLFNIISKAKAEGANGPSVHEVIRRQNPPTLGVGEVAKSVFPQLARTSEEVLEVEDLVSRTSKLWGKIPISSRWEEPSKAKAARTMQFELPWAQYLKSSKLSEDAETQLQQSAMQEAEPAIPVTEPETPRAMIDDEFTLKAGLKRKEAKAESDSELEEADDVPHKPESSSKTSADEEIALLDTDDEKEKAKKARRKAKKAEKKARKQALKQQVQETIELAKRAKKEGFSEAAESLRENGDEDEKPFDYSKANSVLKATRTKGSSSKTPRFNPYGMTAEGPKPGKKMHGEKPGKSATFRK